MQPDFSQVTKLLVASSLSLSVLTICPQTTLAQARPSLSALRQINQEEALKSKPTIALVPGAGLNISFIPTGEIIEKIWLDNPQYATIDVDGCLADLSLNRQCDHLGAQIIHLRRIRDLNFPGLYATNRSLLTVVTHSNSSRNVYTFQLIKGANAPTYNTVEIVPKSDTPNLSNYHTLAKGVQVALARGILKNQSQLRYRIDQFLRRLQTGMPLPTAAAISGVSDAVVLRLHQLGTDFINNPPVHQSPRSSPASVLPMS